MNPTGLMLLVLLGVAALGLFFVLTDQVKLLQAADREVDRVINEPREKSLTPQRAGRYRGEDEMLALQALEDVKRLQEDPGRWEALYHVYRQMQIARNQQMHLPFSDPFSEAMAYNARSLAHDAAKVHLDFQFRYAPHRIPKDQFGYVSIPLDEETLTSMEEFLRPEREPRGQRS